ELASTLHMHRNILRKYLKAYGLERRFDELSNSDLDNLVKVFKATKPNSGLCYLIGFLRSHGIRVQ
ncbi:hypothetical protein NEOLEDRAFT_1023508, partial [Neolentinus lepideus HHB14362 ss-1]